MVSRREFLIVGAGGVAAATAAQRVTAQTPKRGGVLSLRLWDPPHFDHILAHAYRTHVVISFTHSQYYTGGPRNRTHVADPALDDLLVRKPRAVHVKARREVIQQIQRHLAKQQYYVHSRLASTSRCGTARSRTTDRTSAFDNGGRLVAA
jgi:hypothetical protein